MLKIESTSRPFIGEITGVDLGRGVDDATYREILDAWVKYPVLVFPDQDIDSDAQQAFAERLGPLAGRTRPKSERGKNAQDNPNMMLVSNVRDENGVALGAGDYPLAFHTDGCFNEIPTLATILYGIEVPAKGGETLFADMSEVYEMISPETRERILSLKGVHYHHFSFDKYLESGDKRPPSECVPQHAVHPMVIAHPTSKKPVIYANRHNTREIDGMDPSEAEKIFDEIFDAIERPDRIYAHKWREGELVMWDNRAVQHARAHCEPDQRRMLRRFAVQSKEPLKPYRQ